MSTYTQTLYHIVFSTKHRIEALDKERRPELFAYIWGVLKAKNCHLYRINGVEDHLHIATSVHQSIALADLVRDIKSASSGWIRDKRVFPRFKYWQEGYGALTQCWSEKDSLIEYVKNQEEHHATESSIDELRRLLAEAGVRFEEKYLG